MKRTSYVRACTLVILMLLIISCSPQGATAPTTTPAAPLTVVPAATSTRPPAATPTTAPAATPTTAPAVSIKRGGLITFYEDGKWGETDPHMSLVGSKRLWNMIGDSALEWDWQTGQVKPGLVEKWEVSTDGLQFTFHVKQGVKFQDRPPVNGRELTAEDVAFSLMRISGKLNPDLPAAKFPRSSTLAGMLKAEAVDKYTVKVTMSVPSAGFLVGVADPQNAIVAKETVAFFGGTLNKTLEASIGTGPFILTDFEDGVKAAYKKNPNYWKTGADGKPLPYLDEARVVWITDPSSIVAAVASGQIAMYERASPSQIKTLQDAKANVAIVPNNRGVRYSAYFNTTRPPFNDIRVRKAISMLIDREQIMNFDPGPGLWWYGTGLTSDHAEMIPSEELAKRPGIRKPTPEDVALAKRLLTDAGYPPKEINLTMITAPTRTCGQSCPLFIKEQLEKALPGVVKITIEELDPAQRVQRNAQLNFDISWSALGTVTDAGAFLFQTYHSKGATNFTGYSNPKMDALLEAQAKEYDTAKRLSLLREIQELGLEDVPLLIVGSGGGTMIMQPYIRGWNPGPDTGGGDIYYVVEQVWFDK